MPSSMHCRLTDSPAFGAIIAHLSADGEMASCTSWDLQLDLQLADLAVQIVDHPLLIVDRRRLVAARKPVRWRALPAPASRCESSWDGHQIPMTVPPRVFWPRRRRHRHAHLEVRVVLLPFHRILSPFFGPVSTSSPPSREPKVSPPGTSSAFSSIVFSWPLRG